jgi:RHS repeat-associated protein
VKKFVLAVLISLSSIVCLAQTQPNLENGWKPYGSYDGSHLDTVNLMNGNLMFHIPLVADVPQRGSLKVSNVLYGTSKDWQVVCTFNSQAQRWDCNWQKGGAGVNINTTPNLNVHRTLNKQYQNGAGLTTYGAYGYAVGTADGGSHPVHGVAGTEDANGEPTQFDSADMSGYHIALSVPDASQANILDQVTITDRSGNQYVGNFGSTTGCGRVSKTGLQAPGAHPPQFDDTPSGDVYCSQVAYATLVTDSNGNQMSIRTTPSTIPTDTLGRTPPLNYGTTPTTDYSGCASSHAFTSALLYPYVDPNGATQQVKLCYAEITIQTNFQQPNPFSPSVNVVEAATGVSGLHFIPIVSVVLADGTHWTFDYDNYGELSFIALPTGGSISYTWTTINFNACDPTNNSQKSRAVATRTVNDGQGHLSTWTYTWSTPSTTSFTNKVTDPLGNDVLHTFTELSSLAAVPAKCRFYETSSTVYQGAQSASNPIQHVDTTFTASSVLLDDAGSGAPVAGLANVFATDVTTSLYSNGVVTKVKKIHKDPDHGLGAGLPIFGNVIRELEYDWGQGGPGALLRETDTTYKWQTNSAYRTAGLLDLPAAVAVIDPTGLGPQKSNCPGWDASGNAVTKSCAAETDYVYDEPAYLTGAGVSTQHFAPPNGVRGNLTTTSHWLNTISSFVSGHTSWYDTGEPYQKIDPLGHTATLTYDPIYVGGYVTQTCSPTTSNGAVTHCVSGTYDFTTGVLKSFTDQNGQTSNYAYDQVFRITSAQAPADPANGSVRATTTLSYSTGALPWSVTRTRSVTNALSDSATTLLDGLGRVYQTQHPTPSGTAKVDTVYDAAGHVATVSNPYFSTSDPTYGITQTVYDGADRPVLVQKADGSFSTATYQDNCTLAEDEAGKARRTCSDGLGRLYEVEEPGDASAPVATDTSTVSIQATAMVSLGGSEQVVIIPAPPCPPRQICDQTPDTIYDSGNVSVTVNGHQTSAAYGQGDTASSVALNLANAITNDGAAVVNATASGTQITLKARSGGEAGDYTVSFSTAYDTGDFSKASFTGLVSSFRLLGGADLNQFAHVYLTQYQYDGLGNLLCVEQHGNVAPGTLGATGCSAAPSSDAGSPWRVRRFSYDSLSRLLTAQNPESGTISYSYDPDGELLQKTSPQPNAVVGSTATQSVSYCYDELHRVTGKAYGALACPLAAPVVSYVYDSGANAKGKLTSLADQAGTASYGYDILGRMTGESRTIAGISKSLSYTYNLDGSMKSLTYPSGATVTYTPDSAGRILSAVDSGNSINYATGATYGPDGAMTGFVSGNSSTFAGITNTYTYNKRLQPVNMSASAPSQTVFSIGYDFHIGNGVSGADNGNVWGITNYKDNSRNQSFTYDQLNRLTSAQNAGTNCATTTVNGKTEYWGNSYGYDAWGNLLAKTVTKCGAENLSLTAAANNQLQGGYLYDAAGNMTHDATSGLNYTYDVENRITGAGGYTYTYDGDGNRVEKANGSTGTLYWYMTLGIVGESDLTGTMKSEYVFFGGERVARRDLVTPTGVFYYFSDHLKTASVITDSAGNIKSESDYYPWGGELQFTNNDSNHYKFTGKERDSESGLDLMGARYYSSSLGRFTKPDPLMIQKQKLLDPQQWNMYQYARNNPLRFTDPTGKYVCADSAKCDSKQDTDFEKARQRDLKSKNPAVVRGAAAWGDPTKNNGSTVKFGDTGKDGGVTTTGRLEADPGSPGKFRAATTTTIQTGLSGTGLDAAVSHEGTHVADAQDFAKTVSSDLMHYDYSKNLTRYQTEVNAYRVTQAVWASSNDKSSYGDGCTGGQCILGVGVKNSDEVINQLLASPENRYNVTPDNQGAHQFPEVPPPN